MAGTQRYQPSTTIEPTPVVPDTTSRLAAAQWDKLAWGADQYRTQFTRQLEDEALRRAEEDAPQILQRDPATGALNQPESFDPPGFAGPTYKARFRQVATNLYTQSAASDFRSKAAEVAASYPNDPGMVSKELDLKIAEMQKALDPAVAKRLAVELEMVKGQAVSGAVAGRTRAEMKTLSDDTMRDLQLLSIEMGKSGLSISKMASIDPAAADLTTKGFQQRWERIVGNMRAMGMPETEIASQRERMDIFTAMRTQADGMHLSIVGAGADPDPAAIIKAENAARITAREFARKHGKYESEVYAFLNGQIGISSQIGRGIIQEATAADNALYAAKMVEWFKVKQEGDPKKIRDHLKATFDEISTNPKLTDASRLRLMSEFSGYRNPVAASAYEQQAATYMTTMTAATSTPEQRLEAAGKYGQLINDPGFERALGARSEAHRTALSGWQMDHDMQTQNVPGMLAAMDRGVYTPAAIADMGAQLRAKGMIGNAPGAITETKWLQAAQAGSAKYLENVERGKAFARSQEGWKNSRIPPSKEMIEYAEKTGRLMRPADGSLNMDMVRMNASSLGIVDPKFKEALNGVDWMRAKAADLAPFYDTARQMMADHRKTFKMEDEAGYIAAEAWIEGELGKDNWRRVKHGIKYDDPNKPLPAAAAGPQTANDPNRSGIKSDQADIAFDGMIKQFEGGTAARLGSFGFGKIMETVSVFSGAEDAPHFRRVAVDLTKHAGPGWVSSVMGGGSIMWSEEAKAAAKEAYADELRTSGSIYIADGKNPYRHALVASMEKARHNFEVRDVEGVPTVLYRPFAMYVRNATGVDLDEKSLANMFASAFLPPGIDRSQWDPERMRVRATQGPLGEQLFTLQYKDRNTLSPMPIMTIASDDPRLRKDSLAFMGMIQRELVAGKISPLEADAGTKLVNKWTGGLFDNALMTSEVQRAVTALAASPTWSDKLWIDLVTSTRNALDSDERTKLSPQDRAAFDAIRNPAIGRAVRQQGALYTLFNGGARYQAPFTGVPEGPM